VQFVVLSDTNASDYVGRVDVPIFRDASSGRPAWRMMDPGAVKHDSFVFSKAGVRTLFWDARVRDTGKWMTEIRAEVVALGK